MNVEEYLYSGKTVYYNTFIKYFNKEDFMRKSYLAKTKIIEYMLHIGQISKVQLAKDLNLSMPTVISNVNDLLEKGIIIEVGEGQSTGGRKAKLLSLRNDYCFAAGVNITANHISKVIIDLSGKVIRHERERVRFSADINYFNNLAQNVKNFIENQEYAGKVAGIGIALPGIIDQDKGILVKSHALKLENYSLGILEQLMPLPVYFENDANAAMMAEIEEKDTSAVYLSLNNTLGGAVRYHGGLIEGQNHKAGEFGHMILIPEGEMCYCGKQGCADVYCSARTLSKHTDDNLELFFEKIEKGDEKMQEIWRCYLKHLAILITNLRMSYDLDIILGGMIGLKLPAYMLDLGEYVLEYNLFEQDLNYLKTCGYHVDASAEGVARYFIDETVRKIE